MAQRYGTMAAHRASVLDCSVLEHMYSFDGLISRRHRRRSVTLQSPTATLIPQFSSSEHTVCGFTGLIVRICAAGGSRTLDFLCERRTLYPLGLRSVEAVYCFSLFNWSVQFFFCFLWLPLGSTFIGTDRNGLIYQIGPDFARRAQLQLSQFVEEFLSYIYVKNIYFTNESS